MLTEEQQRIKALVESATTAPHIDVNDISPYQPEMIIPKGVKRPENSYRYIGKQNLHRAIHRLGGGIWEIVNRHNHSHVPSDVFSETGCIEYRGELILCYAARETSELLEKKVLDEHNRKVDSEVNSLDGKRYSAGGRAEVVLEMNPSTAGETYAEELTSDGDYDFGAPTEADE
jgi:hypothetical protein